MSDQNRLFDMPLIDMPLTERAPYLTQGVRIMLLAPDNPSLPTAMKTRHIFESTAQPALMSQELQARVFEGISADRPELRISRDKSMNSQTMLSEKGAIVIPYRTSRDTLRSPYIYAWQKSCYPDALMEELDFVWGHTKAPAQPLLKAQATREPKQKKDPWKVHRSGQIAGQKWLLGLEKAYPAPALAIGADLVD